MKEITVDEQIKQLDAWHAAELKKINAWETAELTKLRKDRNDKIARKIPGDQVAQWYDVQTRKVMSKADKEKDHQINKHETSRARLLALQAKQKKMALQKIGKFAVAKNVVKIGADFKNKKFTVDTSKLKSKNK